MDSSTSEKKPETYEQIISRVILADFKKTIEEAKRPRRRHYPDPVKPQWKN